MKSFSTFKESIIDIPRSTYAPMVFDKEDTSNPVIKPSVIKMIDDQLAEFAKEYPVLKYTLIGSILTHRYRNDADLDINVLFDVPVEQQEDERLRLSKKYLHAWVLCNEDNFANTSDHVLCSSSVYSTLGILSPILNLYAFSAIRFLRFLYSLS